MLGILALQYSLWQASIPNTSTGFFLGHDSISITLDTYSTVIKGMDGGLADTMDEAL